MVVSADVSKEGQGMPAPCQLNDVVRIACCCEEGGSTDAEGVAVDASGEICTG